MSPQAATGQSTFSVTIPSISPSREPGRDRPSRPELAWSPGIVARRPGGPARSDQWHRRSRDRGHSRGGARSLSIPAIAPRDQPACPASVGRAGLPPSGEMPLPQTLLVIVGDELLGGFTTDTNGALAARRLFEAGYPVRRIEIVGDIVEDIAVAVRRGIDDPSITRVIVAGGIGPDPGRSHPRGGRPGPGPRRWWSIPRRSATSRPWWPGCTPPAGCRARHPPRPTGRWPGWPRGWGSWTTRGAWLPASPWSWARHRLRRRPRRASGGIRDRSRRGRDRGGGPLPWSRWLFVLPGVPREFAAVLEEVLIPSHFAGSRAMAVVETRHPGAVEADFAEPMRRLELEFPDVAVGSYPQQRGRDLVIRLRGTDPARVRAAGGAPAGSCAPRPERAGCRRGSAPRVAGARSGSAPPRRGSAGAPPPRGRRRSARRSAASSSGGRAGRPWKRRSIQGGMARPTRVRPTLTSTSGSRSSSDLHGHLDDHTGVVEDLPGAVPVPGTAGRRVDHPQGLRGDLVVGARAAEPPEQLEHPRLEDVADVVGQGRRAVVQVGERLGHLELAADRRRRAGHGGGRRPGPRPPPGGRGTTRSGRAGRDGRRRRRSRRHGGGRRTPSRPAFRASDAVRGAQRRREGEAARPPSSRTAWLLADLRC